MHDRGMTLVEILVALLITMILMSFLGTIYVRTMYVRRRTEEIAEIHATAGAVFSLLRRDLAGAFRLPVETYDFGDVHGSGSELHWDALDGSGYHMLTFIAANDGSRRKLDELRPYEYNMVSWFVRGTTLYRQIGSLDIPIGLFSLPTGWHPEETDPGLSAGEAIYSDVSSPVVDAGTYAGRPYIVTTTTDPAANANLSFTQDGVPLPVTMTVCFAQPRVNPLPGWVAGFTPVADTISVDVGGQVVSYKPYALACESGNVFIGPNYGDPADRMYFVIFEPLWFSLSEDIDNLAFAPPPPSDYTITNGTGGVPKYVDVTLTISDPDHPLGRRVFGERIAIPAGVVP